MSVLLFLNVSKTHSMASDSKIASHVRVHNRPNFILTLATDTGFVLNIKFRCCTVSIISKC